MCRIAKTKQAAAAGAAVAKGVATGMQVNNPPGTQLHDKLAAAAGRQFIDCALIVVYRMLDKVPPPRCSLPTGTLHTISMQAATVEVGTSLVQTITAAGGKDSKNAGDQAKKGPVPEPVKMVGGIGMELLRVSCISFLTEY